jgi:hypothetical protein
MHNSKNRFKLWNLASYVTLGAVALVTGTTALAEPYQGKYRGNSASWVPDYAGTIELKSSGRQTYTAIADVELRQKPTSIYDPNPTTFQYEMRGQITVTSPYTITNSSGKVVMTCTPAGPVPVSIRESGMMLHTKNSEDMPPNTYEFHIHQYVRLPKCVNETGKLVQLNNESMQVSFNTSNQPASAPEPTVTLSRSEQAEVEKQSQAAQAIVNNPALQREWEKIIERDTREYERTGKKPTTEQIVSDMERLQQSGLVPDASQIPTLSPELRRKLEAQSPKSDHSHLRRFTDVNQLSDKMTVDHGTVVFNVSWNLRRVNGR